MSSRARSAACRWRCCAASSLGFLPYHFDFVRDGAVAFSVNRKFSLRDRYVITIKDPQLDRRLVIAMAVALDALQAR